MVIGEDKPLNNIEEAKDQITSYLNNRAASQGAEYGIATDGIDWVVYRIDLGGDYLDFTSVGGTPFSFREELLQIAHQRNYISQSVIEDVDIDQTAEQFAEVFSRDRFNRLLTHEAPKAIRENKKKGVEEFYDLYVELLFGEGSGDYSYDTSLLGDIDAPETATETEKRKFSIRLVNRLLFTKFLEDRGILPSQFLTERVDQFREAEEQIDTLAAGLYKAQLEPLFFHLFNTEKEDRKSEHRGGWFDQVPYLNGSLFAPTEGEHEYDVSDRMLVTVVKDLIEGHKLGDGNGGGPLDPAILGNVFEMTINHITEDQSQKDENEEDTSQRSEGAYYTPSDVIRLITEQTVDPKIYDELVDVYTERLTEASDRTEEEARRLITDYTLDEILGNIEQGNGGFFEDPRAIKEAYNRIGDLKILDPACGSGHFLTAVLDEVHRVRMSLLRGLKREGPDDADFYRDKKELVLNAIYGVDINPIAIEIAKLRVWLKMVERGWEPEFGELPNIDVNIVDGNSLVGLPEKTSTQRQLRSFDVDLTAIEEIRQRYKAGEITRRELDQKIAELRPELRSIYTANLVHHFEASIESIDEFDQLVNELDTDQSIYSVTKAARARREDGSELTDNDKEKLEELGFRTYTKSARLSGQDLEEREGDFRRLIREGFTLELERQPTLYDVRKLEEFGDLSRDPFHWIVQFPEAVVRRNDGYSVAFDIVVGNPPYGDLLNEIEKRFTSGYDTGQVNDVAAQFLERELQVLGEQGHFGNVITLRLIYDQKAYPARGVLARHLPDARIACFGWRPSYIFAGSEALVAIITGRKGDPTSGDIQTSRFILFNDEDRKAKLENIEYCGYDGLILGDRIGSGSVGETSDKAWPKVGTDTSKAILEKLRDAGTPTIREVELDEETDHAVWRREGARYWINPLLDSESLWSEDDRPREVMPIYFESELERYSAFLLLQSSLFYHFWMAYSDQQHVSWKQIRPFPFPNIEDLKKRESDIERLAKELWKGIKNRFKPDVGVSGEIQGVKELKPLVDEIDELFGPMYDLTSEEIEYVTRLDTEYGRSPKDPMQERIDGSS